MSCGLARGGRRNRTRVGLRARGRRAGAEQWRAGELRPCSRRASRSRREARRTAGGGRWSGSVLRGQAGEQTGAAPAGAVDGTAPGRAAAAG